MIKTYSLKVYQPILKVYKWRIKIVKSMQGLCLAYRNKERNRRQNGRESEPYGNCQTVQTPENQQFKHQKSYEASLTKVSQK